MPRFVWHLIQLIFVMSGLAMTLTATLRGTALAGIIGLALSFVLYCWLIFYKNILEETIRKFSPLSALAALPYAAAATKIFMGYFYFRFEKLSEEAVSFLMDRFSLEAARLSAMVPHAKTVITVLTGIALWMVAYHMICAVRLIIVPLIRSLNGAEIALLLTGAAISMALIFIVYSHTNLFFLPARDGVTVKYDAVFTTDTGILMETNAFVNVNAGENDLRHPLFGLFSMPFGIMASWITFCFRGHELAYVLSLSFMQVMALLLSMVMASRIANLRHLDQIGFLLLYFISFPSLLFLLTIEQYIIALFWLMLYLYSLFQYKANEGGVRELCFAGAAGALLTSGFFIVFSPGKGGVKQALLTLLRTGFTFAAFVVAFGQAPMFADAVEAIKKLSRFAEFTLPLEDKLRMYLAFVADCLFAPGAGISDAYAHISYQLPIAEGYNPVGIAILALALIGFLLNIKNKFCILSFSWVLFSYCLLGLAGWGAAENGMILYSLYFSWALLALIFAGLTKAMAKHPFIRFAIAAAIFVVTAALNIRELREMIHFGLFYYPM